MSFEAAMLKLGGGVVSTENAGEFSSAAKGESLEDTIRVVAGYADVIVLRHHEEGSSNRAAAVSDVPVINAGDGPGQHPTQALLDLYTVKSQLGQVDGLRYTFVGDLANGRTVRSLAYLLGKYYITSITFVSPEVVRMGDDIKAYLNRHSIKWSETEDLLAAASVSDVLYVTRIQKERFKDRPDDYEKAHGKFVVDASVAAVMPKKSIIMHPLPRTTELNPEIDRDPRAVYIQQARNAMCVRQALLLSILYGDAI
jgi:aspartate carbamoyltransferase catalytic subunit